MRTFEIIYKFFLEYFKDLEKEYTIEYIGNNLNEFLTTEKIDEIIQNYIYIKNTRRKKASMDVIRGRLFEKIVEFLLNEYFKKDLSYHHIKATTITNLPIKIRELIDKIQLHRRGTLLTKKPDIDVVVYSEKYNDRVIMLSVKGTARERIGQFLSDIFIFDENVIKEKYKGKYYFKNNLPQYQMIFVCFDMAKQKDFSFENETRAKEKMMSSTKQMEVYLIDDDLNIGGGVYVINNLYKLHKVGNFSQLVAKLKSFFP
jgi:hypothetical protein